MEINGIIDVQLQFYRLHERIKTSLSISRLVYTIIVIILYRRKLFTLFYFSKRSYLKSNIYIIIEYNIVEL